MIYEYKIVSDFVLAVDNCDDFHSRFQGYLNKQGQDSWELVHIQGFKNMILGTTPPTKQIEAYQIVFKRLVRQPMTNDEQLIKVAEGLTTVLEGLNKKSFSILDIYELIKGLPQETIDKIKKS